MTLRIAAIAAMDEGRVIGIDNKIPWHIPEDAKHFKELTMGHAVLMGRKTYESLPARFKPLPGRKNIVISSNPSLVLGQDVEVWSDPIKCIEHYRAGRGTLPSDWLWIVGGEAIYRATLPFWDELELTRIFGRHTGDSYFPEFENEFKLDSREAHEKCAFEKYLRA